MSKFTAGKWLDELIAKGIFHWQKEDAPPFSTDITFAWYVVERMIQEGWGIDLSIHNSFGYAINVVDKDHEQLTDTEEETMPLAICVAAVLAYRLVEEVKIQEYQKNRNRLKTN